MRRDFLRLCALAGLGLVIASPAADWPQWRGPNHDGISIESGLLKAWPKEGLPLAWKATGLGEGYATVAVAAGRIFSAGHTNDAEMVFALDERTGKALWSASVSGGRYIKVNVPGSRAMPTVDGERIYALSVEGNLVCLDAATGKLRWERHLRREFRGGGPDWGYSESALVDGDVVLCTPGGQQGAVIAFNKLSGELIWQSAEFKDPAQYASLVAADIAGTRQYIQLTMASVAGIEAKTGKLLWQVPRQGDRGGVITTPIHADGLVFVTSGQAGGRGDAYAVTKDAGAFKVAEVWTTRDMKNHHGGVILHQGHLYGHSDSRGWICQEFKTGKVVWSDRGVGKGSVTCADGMLYCRHEESKDGAVALVELSPIGYKERGRFNPPDRSTRAAWAHPVVANGKLYLRDMDVLLCYDVKAK